MTSAIARTFYRWVGGNTTLPVTLGLRNIYILPTGYGVLYLAALMAMLTGSVNYNNNLGFLLSFLLGSLGLTGLMYTYGMLYGLRLQAATADPVFAGARAEVEIAVAGIGRLRTGIRWYFEDADQTIGDLRPGVPARVRVRAATDRRGVFRPGWLHIVCEYPLGLFRAWGRIDTGVASLVYPRPVAAPAPSLNSQATHGPGDSVEKSGVDDFQGLSAYQPGDSPRRIHWQAYSRGRGLHTKTFSGQVGTHLMLDIKDIAGEDLERRLSILCFFVLRAHHQRHRFGLRLAGQIIPAGSGRVHRDRCLRALALYGRD